MSRAIDTKYDVVLEPTLSVWQQLSQGLTRTRGAESREKKTLFLINLRSGIVTTTRANVALRG